MGKLNNKEYYSQISIKVVLKLDMAFIIWAHSWGYIETGYIVYHFTILLVLDLLLQASKCNETQFNGQNKETVFS